MKEFFNYVFGRTARLLRKQIAALEKELAEFKEKLEELENKAIVVALQDDSDMNVGPKSVRVNFYVWEDWKQFCEDHEEYSKKQLISLALKEFMEKHQ